jgi:hypothetical protein
MNKIKDARLAFTSANAFLEHAKPFYEDVKRSKKPYEMTLKKVGNLASSATNLTFAVELYLKSYRIIVGESYISNHNLFQQFEKLPDKHKNEIRKRYFNLLVATNDNALQDLNLLIKSEQKQITKQEYSKGDNESKTIDEVLRRSSGKFTIWRYIFDSHEKGKKFTKVKIEYGHLLLICKVFKSLINEMAKGDNLDL